jgi:alpha-1,2-mannosyltransferase
VVGPVTDQVGLRMHDPLDDERRRHRARVDLAIAAALLLVGLGVALGIVASKSANPTGLLDLRIYRDAARGISRGTLYDYEDPNFGLGFTYPPFAAVLFAGLVPLPERALEFGWTILAAASWLAVIACLWRRSIRGHAPQWACDFPTTTVAGAWLISLLGAPIWLALNQGQVGVFLWVALTADVVFTIDKRRAAGVLTGLAAATKVLPLVAIPLYLVGDRAQAAKRAVLAFAAATVFGVILLPSESRRYWGDLLWGTRVGEQADTRNDSLSGVLTRTIGEGRLTTILAVALGLGLLVLGAISFRAAVQRNAALTAILVLGSTMGLMSPITWTHHLVFLSLLVLFPLLSWRDRPTASAIALAVVIVVLIDPLGAGNADVAFSSSVRAFVMLAILVFHNRLVGLEQPREVKRPGNPEHDCSYLDRR